MKTRRRLRRKGGVLGKVARIAVKNPIAVSALASASPQGFAKDLGESTEKYYDDEFDPNAQFFQPATSGVKGETTLDPAYGEQWTTGATDFGSMGPDPNAQFVLNGGRTRRRQRGGVNPLRALGLVVLTAVGVLRPEPAEALTMGEAWIWLNQKHSPDEIQKAADAILKNARTLEIPSVTGIASNMIVNVLEDYNEHLTAPEAASMGPTVTAMNLRDGHVYRDANGKEFEVATWGSNGTNIKITTRDGTVMTVPETTEYTFVRDAYAATVEDDVGGRRARRRRRTLRRRKTFRRKD